MEEYWQTTYNHIYKSYNIHDSTDWLKNGKLLLKKFIDDLEEVIINLISKENDIAKEILSPKDYGELTKKEDPVRKIFLHNNADRILVDERTLEKRLVEKSVPTQTKVKNLFSVFCYHLPYEGSLKKWRAENLQTGIPNIFEQLENTNWWVYYYDYDESTRTGHLGRAVLEIKSKNQIFLTNVESETATNYSGLISLERSNQHLFFDLYAVNIPEKHLRIIVFKGIGKVYPIMLGVYTNIYSTNAMVAGSIMLEKIDPETTSELKAQKFEFNDSSVEVHESIKAFFSKREKNFIKTASNILTISKLNKWIDEKSRE